MLPTDLVTIEIPSRCCKILWMMALPSESFQFSAFLLAVSSEPESVSMYQPLVFAALSSCANCCCNWACGRSSP
ncbi:Uncharacterised protein [Vibrio cholerae]|nr:Uncharacterised protein [Vibrio cholerae]